MQLHGFLPKAGVALFALTLTFATVGTAATASPERPDGATVVLAHDFMFAPLSLTVKAGSTVTWTNKDEEPHTVTSDTGLFRSGALDTNDSFSYRFEKPGTYHYLCSIHPRMTGTIIVQ
jgi:plastocyanin